MTTSEKHLSATAAGRRGIPLASLASAGVVVVVLALGQITAGAGPSPAKLTPQAYERVKEGMGREEVQAALRLPAGDYRDAAHKPGGRSHTDWSEQAAEEEFGSGETAGRLAWEGNEYSIVVGFDQAGVVRWKTLWKHVPPHAP
jgi:hypothetical protein